MTKSSPVTASHTLLQSRNTHWLVLGSLLLLYAMGSYGTHLPPGDAVGFWIESLATSNWPNLAPNATNHALYQLALWQVAKGSSTLHHSLGVPILDSALIMSGISILGAMASLVILRSIILGMTSQAKVANLVMLAMGLSFTFWRHACMQEVYSIYLTCFLLQIRLLISGADKRTGAQVLLFLITCWLHIAHILLLPVLWWAYWRALPSARASLVILGTFLGPASLLLVAYLINGNWADAINAVFFDSVGSGEVLQLSGLTVLKGIALGFVLLAYNFGGFGMASTWSVLRLKVLAPRSWLTGILNTPSSYQALGLALLLQLAYITRYANLQVAPFYLPTYSLLLILVAQQLSQVSQQVFRRIAAMTLLQPIVYIGTYLIVLQVPSANPFHQQKAYKGGLYYYTLPWAPLAPQDVREVMANIIMRKITGQFTQQDKLVLQDLGYVAKLLISHQLQQPDEELSLKYSIAIANSETGGQSIKTHLTELLNMVDQ